MSSKRYSNEQKIQLLQQIEIHRAIGGGIHTACRAAGITDTTYYNWRKMFMGQRACEDLPSKPQIAPYAGTLPMGELQL